MESLPFSPAAPAFQRTLSQPILQAFSQPPYPLIKAVPEGIIKTIKPQAILPARQMDKIHADAFRKLQVPIILRHARNDVMVTEFPCRREYKRFLSTGGDCDLKSGTLPLNSAGRWRGDGPFPW